ncbi:hypothetical protein [Paenisporosarcina sp. OV554]|uniref:hypothetical protein n=1 Tax=Paenisporosarcina sp. OV554 TaxID=2135694 RepID=UPI000D431512|nr:hypothetical protein [Paenisporosarcina sp. OV554]PUB09920.1 hypothetical protein C8K15_12324 [Paenisporosarcina sp. OV554]
MYVGNVFVVLLTAVGIMFWLANHVEKEDISWEITVESTLCTLPSKVLMELYKLKKLNLMKKLANVKMKIMPSISAKN